MFSFNQHPQFSNLVVLKYVLQIPIPFIIGLSINTFSSNSILHFLLIVIMLLLGFLLFAVNKILKSFEAYSKFRIKVYGGKSLTDDRAYSIYESYVTSALWKVKVISPKKPKQYQSKKRSQYFSRVEDFIEKKTKETKDFIYKRIVPSRAVPNDMENTDKYLHEHAMVIEHKYYKSIDIGVRWVNEWLIPINFIIVDDEHLMLMLP